jgi:uncharacterized phage protein gp47/JayE
MKDYIRERMEKKVADKIAAAEKAKNDLIEKDEKALKAVKAYAEFLIPEATKKVIAFAKKQGLTWFDHTPSWYGINEDINLALSVSVDSSDFEETNTSDRNTAAARKVRRELEEAPKRIKKAVNDAVNAIVFSLELGKVKKAELEELIASTEVGL